MREDFRRPAFGSETASALECVCEPGTLSGRGRPGPNAGIDEAPEEALLAGRCRDVAGPSGLSSVPRPRRRPPPSGLFLAVLKRGLCANPEVGLALPSPHRRRLQFVRGGGE